MAIKIIENGKVEKLTLHSSDITVLDVANKFKDKNLESVITEISDTEHLHIGEVDLEKEGVWIEDNEILDSDESNGVVDRLKNYFSSIVGDLKALTTNSKDTLVNAINENTSNISKLSNAINENISKVNQLSNPNLFVNDCFKIWQRGTTFNTSGWNTVYTSDRWGYGSEKSTKVEKTDNGLKITALESGSAANIYQRLEDDVIKNLVGKKVTLTFYTKEATELCNKLWVAGVDDGKKFYYADIPFSNKGTKNTFSTTIEVTKFTKNIEFGFQMKASEVGNSVELIGAKLEVGDKATPIIPRNYGEELALCQRYYQTHTPGGVANETNCLAIMSRLPVIMRINPTISYVPNSAIHEHGKGGVGTVEDITEVQCHTDRVDFIVTRQDYFTVGKAYNVEGICLDSEIY